MAGGGVHIYAPPYSIYISGHNGVIFIDPAKNAFLCLECDEKHV